MSFPKVVIETETDSEESSSDEEDDVVEEEEEGGAGEEVVQPEDSEEEEEEEEDEEKEKLAVKKTPISISLKKVCKVSLLYFSVCFVLFYFYFFMRF